MNYGKVNWFNIVKYSLLNMPSDYTDIGHKIEDDCDSYMWIWDKGQFSSRKAVGDERHEDIWDIVFGEVYSGRYDECKNMISIAIPPQLENKTVPTALIRKLQNTFSNDADIYSFGSNEKATPVW